MLHVIMTTTCKTNDTIVKHLAMPSDARLTTPHQDSTHYFSLLTRQWVAPRGACLPSLPVILPVSGGGRLPAGLLLGARPGHRLCRGLLAPLPSPSLSPRNGAPRQCPPRPPPADITRSVRLRGRKQQTQADGLVRCSYLA